MLEEIRTFVAVVKAGSFTHAADTLGTSRSVISKKLSDLEGQLGVRLLNRTTRRLSLTEAGEQLFQRSSKSLDDIQDAIDESLSLTNEPRGRLYVNLPMSFGIVHVAPLVNEFRQRYPGIQLELNFEDRRVEVIEPGFDVSIRIADLADSSLNARRLCPCYHLVVANADYLQRCGTPSEPLDLTNNHIIISNRLQDAALQWDFQLHNRNGKQPNNGNKETVKLQAGLIANNSLAIKEMVLSGAGIARMPTFLIGSEVATGRLVNLMPDWQTNTKTIYTVFPQREYMPSKTRVFIDFLREKITEQPQWDKGVMT